jgi:hypothetical protein
MTFASLLPKGGGERMFRLRHALSHHHNRVRVIGRMKQKVLQVSTHRKFGVIASVGTTDARSTRNLTFTDIVGGRRRTPHTGGRRS